MHWLGIHWLIGQPKCPRAGAQLVGWSGTAGAGQMSNADTSRVMKLHGVQEASAFTAPISLSFFFFKIRHSCFTELLNHPVTHTCACAIRSFSFLLSQDRQEVIRAALVTLCSRHAARNSQINGDFKSLSKMLQGTAVIKIMSSRNNNY